MAIATFKDLCIDAEDPAVLGRFWGEVLHLEVEYDDDNVDAALTGPTPQHTIWVNRVPEPKSVKHRVHIDIQAASVDEVTAAGATVIDADSFSWTVMTDPEGGELCLFVRDSEIENRLYELVIDCVDPGAIAGWWGDVFGVAHEDSEHGFSSLEGIPGAPFDGIVFVPVPEAKMGKNRIHMDLKVDSIDALTERGATILREPDDEIRWTVMADPEGNEFCAFTS